MADLFSKPDELPVADQVEYLLGLVGCETVPETEVSYQTLDAVIAVVDDRRRLADIVTLARKVREAQKRYFKDRSNLYECKALEGKLDGLLKEAT